MKQLTLRLKEFIEENIDLIEENRWDEVYENASFDLDSTDSTGMFTEAMLDIGLDPIAEQELDWIPDYYLSGTSITEFTIPNTIHSLGEGCFSYSSLKTITIPASVETIRDYVFYECANLEEVIVLGDTRDIGSKVFYGCPENLVVKCKERSPFETYCHQMNIHVEYI